MNKILKLILIMLTIGLLMAGCSADSTSTPQSEAEGNLSTYQLEINLPGKKSEFIIDNQGRLKSKVESSSADSTISLSLDKGTTVLDKDRQPLRVIHAVVDLSPPPLPEDAYTVGPAYNLGPQGAIFDPQLKLTLSYDPETLPEGVREDNLYIAYYDGTEWREPFYKKVDTEVHSVTTHVYHFTTFAILVPKKLAPPSTPILGTRVGNLAPNFQLDNLEGQTISLNDLRDKPVIVNFWATRCSPCVNEMPYIQQVYDEWSGRGLMMLAINRGESSSKVEKFLQSHNLSLPVLLDTNRDVALRYNIWAIPSTFFIDKDGIIKDIKIGAFPSKEEVEKSLSKIMP